MAGWNFSSWLVISEVARDDLFVWGIDQSLQPARWNCPIHVQMGLSLGLISDLGGTRQNDGLYNLMTSVSESVRDD